MGGPDCGFSVYHFDILDLIMTHRARVYKENALWKVEYHRIIYAFYTWEEALGYAFYLTRVVPGW